MAEKRKNKKGFTFENHISLVDWSFNRIEDKEIAAFWKFSNDLEEYVDQKTEKLRKSLKSANDRVREIASEALQIAFEHQIIAAFRDTSQAPWDLEIYMSDFAEDGYTVTLDIREPIRQMLREFCSIKDGYVQKDYEGHVLNFAAMLDELSNELKTAIRPENNDA